MGNANGILTFVFAARLICDSIVIAPGATHRAMFFVIIRQTRITTI